MRGDVTGEDLTEEEPHAGTGRGPNEWGEAAIFDSDFDEGEKLGEVDELLSDYAPVTRGDVTATLVDELRSGSVPESVLADLRDLGLLAPDGDDPSVPRRFEVRLEQMQAELSKLSAYTEAIEAFIDEEGSGRQLLSELQESVARLDAGYVDVATTVERLETEQRGFEARLSDVECQDEELAGLHASVGAVEATVEVVAGENEEAVRGLQAAIAENRQAIQELCDVQERILRAFSGSVDDEPG